MSQRFAETFKKVRDNNKMAFIPYVIGCDPSFDLSLKIMHTLAANNVVFKYWLCLLKSWHCRRGCACI